MSSAAEAPPGARLRVGLVLGASRAPRWIHRIVSSLAAEPGLELIVLQVAVPPVRQESLLLRGYDWLDRARYARPGDALATEELGPRLAALDVRTLSATGGVLDAESLDRLRGLALDLVLCPGPPADAFRASGLARCGVLALRHGCGDDGRSEVFRADPATRTELLRLGAGDSGDAVLERSWAQTDATSVHGSRERCAEKGGEMLLRAVRRLRDGAPFRPLPDAAPDAPPVGSVPLGLSRLGGRRLREMLERLVFEDRWVVASQRAPVWPPDPARFEVWQPPEGLLWADPFPFVREGRSFVFLEEGGLRAPRAHLSVVEVGADGRPGPARPVLERPYHLSYPFVFAWQGEVYLLPETAENGTVELYRCARFPDRWELDRVLLSGLRAYDATLFEDGGRFWMFVCLAVEDGPPMDELHLFHAPGPLGPFTPVAANPVVSDVRRARPAGRIFRAGDALIRPAQDGSGRYGRAVRFQRILRLDPDGYAEQEIAALEPGFRADVLGIHTWNATADLAMVDCIQRRRRF